MSPNGTDQTTDMVIVDTDILIDVGREVREAVNCLQQIEQKFSLAVSIVTQMELIVGCRNKKELTTLEKFLERFHIIRLDEQISDLATDLLKVKLDEFVKSRIHQVFVVLTFYESIKRRPSLRTVAGAEHVC